MFYDQNTLQFEDFNILYFTERHVDEIRNRYGYMTSYRKAWIAKQKAIVRLYGDWDKSYNDLPKWLAAMQHFVPGTIVELQTVPAYHGHQMV